ncbi:tyrosine-type recombinase/integrase [Ferrovibrio sp.]|uniref:tyrosine-type recombinase/integrase n=1 Tax=Ferrovibrio sp. TaxID=1917215 RepID=UPI00351359EA
MTLKNIKSASVPDALQGYCLIDSLRPRYWPTVWAATAGARLAPSTLSQRLSHIDRLYAFSCQLQGSDTLDQHLAHLDFDQIETCLTSYFSYVQNAGARQPEKHPMAWPAAYRFVLDILTWLTQVEAQSHKLTSLFRRLNRLTSLYQNLRPHRSRSYRNVRALPSSVIEEVYEVSTPDSRRNPFRTQAAQERNYALILLFLHQGLRRSEALLLHANPVNRADSSIREKQYTWLNIVDYSGPLDKRSFRPSLKTTASQRQIPISSPLADIVTNYSDNWRGKQPHPFLFSNNRHQPMSVRNVNRIFFSLSSSLSKGAAADLSRVLGRQVITPHDLRHTCAVVRLTQFIDAGTEMAVALQKLRAFFGWSYASEMPRHYARAYFENRLSTVWSDQFDIHTDALRRLESTNG